MVEKPKLEVESKRSRKIKGSESAPGEKIRAMGFNGEIVGGWKVMHRGKKGQWVLERTDENGEKLKKTISDEERLLWNPEPVAVPEAESEAVATPVAEEDVAAPIERETNSNEFVREYGSVSRAASKESHEKNEDRILARPEDGFFGVFDGMGGHAGGERASELAKATIEKKLKELPKDMDAKQAKDALWAILNEANQAVLDEQKRDPQLKEMGTTASLVKLISDGEKQFAVIVTVGDSPVYVVRKNGADGELECMGIDNDMLGVTMPGSPREIKEADARLANVKTIEDYAKLEDHERDAFDRRNVLVNGPVGSSYMLPEDYLVQVEPGDRIVIASDGITDNLTRERIAQIVGNHYSERFRGVPNVSE